VVPVWGGPPLSTCTEGAESRGPSCSPYLPKTRHLVIKKSLPKRKHYIESSNSINQETKVKLTSLGFSWFKSGCRKYRLLGGRLQLRYQCGQLS
jgi:hypothetical protein